MSTIIFLHGASSSGKSTLAKAIRTLSRQPFIHLSWDTYRDSGAIDPLAYDRWAESRPRVFEGLHQSFAAFANAGCDLIVEHILDTDGWHNRLQHALWGHDLLFVGLFVPVNVLAQREHTRGDRPLGSAEQDAGQIHTGLTYDLEIDATRAVDETAQVILQELPAIAERRSRFFDPLV